MAVLPQCILLSTDYLKGVYSWEFVGETLWEKGTPIYEGNDALFKHPFGNTIFATATGVFYSILILIFFNNEIFCCHKSIPCRCIDILSCHFPDTCINYTDPILDITPSSTNTGQKEKKNSVTLDHETDLQPPKRLSASSVGHCNMRLQSDLNECKSSCISLA